MTKKELEERVKELKNNGYGKTNLTMELELAITEYLLEEMEENDTCKEDLYYIADGLLEHIRDNHIGNNLEDYIVRG